MTLMTQKELCEMLQIDITTLWRWRKKGFPTIKIGQGGKAPVRFDREAVQEWLNNHKEE